MRFERAMKFLRAGAPIRRKAWHPESKIIKVGRDVFVCLPKGFERAPRIWRPYPEDFLAIDWVVAEGAV